MKRVLGICILLICTAALFVGCKKEEKDPGYDTISMEESKSMMVENRSFTVLDVRTEEEYSEGHLKYAKNIPLTFLDDKDAFEVPSKDWLILVYGEDEKSSTEAAKILVKLGYTNVKNLGGIEDWTGELEK